MNTIVRDKNGKPISLIMEDVCVYKKGFVIKVLLTPIGTKIARVLFPQEYKDRDIDELIDQETMKLIAHIFNTDTDIHFEIRNGVPYLYVQVGEGDSDNPYIILPETERAREVYAADYEMDEDEKNPFTYDQVLKYYAPLEYTTEMVINCGKRFVDMFLEKEAGNSKIDEHDTNVFKQILDEFVDGPDESLVTDKSVEYNGFQIDTGVDVAGGRFVRIHFPQPDFYSMINGDMENVCHEITRLCNSTVIKFGEKHCCISIGSNGMVIDCHTTPIALPDADKAIKHYGDLIGPERECHIRGHMYHVMKNFYTIEYTPDTAINCAKRLIDSVFVSMQGRLNIRNKHKDFANMFKENMKKVNGRKSEK